VLVGSNTTREVSGNNEAAEHISGLVASRKLWWRRGESNPGPKMVTCERLRV
jgi:hypothetical protein